MISPLYNLHSLQSASNQNAEKETWRNTTPESWGGVIETRYTHRPTHAQRCKESVLFVDFMWRHLTDREKTVNRFHLP